MDIGKEQLAIFVITIISILISNLLVGVLFGIMAKLVIHLLRGVSLKNLLCISYNIEQAPGNIYRIKIDGSAIFSNFIALKSQLADLPVGKTIIFDLSTAYLIDHTVMDFIHAYRQDYIDQGGNCEIQGLSQHTPAADHELAARIKKS